MNNKGQSLIIFVLLLPLIVLVIAFLIDSSLWMMEKNRIDGIISNNIKEAINKDIVDTNKITNAIKKNVDIDVDVSINDDNLIVKAKSKTESIFGKILDFSWYNLSFNYCGNYMDKTIDKNCR